MTPAGDTWQIDFCSRPLLDDRKKKVWELNVCDSQGGLRFQRYFANNQVNSGELRRALEDLCSEEGVALPARALFFRMQMQTILTRALTDLGVEAVPSRRCVELPLGEIEGEVGRVLRGEAFGQVFEDVGRAA